MTDRFAHPFQDDAAGVNVQTHRRLRRPLSVEAGIPSVYTDSMLPPWPVTGPGELTTTTSNERVMTHAEATSNRGGRVMHDNYGPMAWGGTGEHWDFMQLCNGGPADGGEELRRRICSRSTTSFTCSTPASAAS